MQILPFHKLNKFIPDQVCTKFDCTDCIHKVGGSNSSFFVEERHSTGPLRALLNSSQESKKKEALTLILAVRRMNGSKSDIFLETFAGRRCLSDFPRRCSSVVREKSRC